MSRKQQHNSPLTCTGQCTDRNILQFRFIIWKPFIWQWSGIKGHWSIIYWQKWGSIVIRKCHKITCILNDVTRTVRSPILSLILQTNDCKPIFYISIEWILISRERKELPNLSRSNICGIILVWFLEASYYMYVCIDQWVQYT